MTAIASEAVDTTALDALDFDEPVLCDINECHHDKINARAAVSLLVRTHDCCGEAAPACRIHVTAAVLMQMLHYTSVCPKHLTTRCAHVALTIEPLA